MSDLISRQEAIEYFMTNTNWHDEDGYEIDDSEEKRKLLTDYFDGVPSANQWIPVSERLPEEGRGVLCYTPKYNNIWALIRLHDKWKMLTPYANDEYDEFGQGEIVAWMPLPEPWRGEEDADCNNNK